MSYTIEVYYTDNGREYTGSPGAHVFMTTCWEAEIEQSLPDQRRTPRTNETSIGPSRQSWRSSTCAFVPCGEGAERRHSSRVFTRRMSPRRFVNWYNWVEPHKGIENLTRGEELLEYFTSRNCKQHSGFLPDWSSHAALLSGVRSFSPPTAERTVLR